MPILRIDVIEGRSEAELNKLLDAIHCAMLAAFKVPERDRYQIVYEHPASEMRIEDTGLGIPRTERIVMVQVTTRPRSRFEKQNFYELPCQELVRRCEVKASDVVVSITENADEDWSFGYSRAQFITGELCEHRQEFSMPPTITREHMKEEGSSTLEPGTVGTPCCYHVRELRAADSLPPSLDSLQGRFTCAHGCRLRQFLVAKFCEPYASVERMKTARQYFLLRLWTERRSPQIAGTNHAT